MPQEKIIISFKAVGNKELTRAIRDLDNATRELQGKAKRYNDTAVTGVRNNRLLNNSFATLRSKMLLFSFAMSMGIRQLMGFAKEAAKVEAMGMAFNTLSGGTGKASMAMDKLQKATNGTMSEFNLFQQANNAMILGVSKNSDEMGEMFDIAQRLGRALGRDTASSVESLITGIGRQSRLMLDNIGIIVKAEEAYESYADVLGVNVDQLTDAQRKTAFLEATMASAREKVATLGDETLTTQDSYDKLESATSNATVSMGNFVSTIFNLPAASEAAASALDSLAGKMNAVAFAQGVLNKETISAVSNEETLLFTIKEVENEISNLSQSVHRDWGESFEEAFGKRATNQQKENMEGLRTELGLLADRLNEINILMVGGNKPLIFAQADEIVVKVEEEISARQRLLGVLTEEEQKKLEIGQAGLAISGEMLGQFNDMTSAMSAGVNARMKNEMDTLKATSAYQRADADGRKKMEKGVTDNYAQERTRLAKFEKASNLAQAGINIATAITKVLPNVFLASLVAAMGSVQIGAILGTPIPKFATGGMIGGRRHSQGGTMIEAEQGEFVMSRSAVQSVGIENLNRMNEGGGSSAVTVNVSGNVLSQDFVEGELAENIKEAIRRGTDFGIS